MSHSSLKTFTTLPNFLTLLRLLCVPVLWALALHSMKNPFALLLIIAGLTDILDGYFARKFRQETAFGCWFDSLADNTLLLSTPF